MSKEINVPCQTFIRVMQCDCGGELRFTQDLKDLGEGPPYKHICNKCGNVEYFESTYPQTFSIYSMSEIEVNKDESEN